MKVIIACSLWFLLGYVINDQMKTIKQQEIIISRHVVIGESKPPVEIKPDEYIDIDWGGSRG